MAGELRTLALLACALGALGMFDPDALAADNSTGPGTNASATRAAAKPLAKVEEPALSPEQLGIAAQVHAGDLPCDDKVRVVLAADAKVPGYFELRLGSRRHRVFPVESRTGAIRLEDSKSDLVWIQLSNKSMLMSRKLGRRLADECKSELQAAVASAMRINPPPSLLEPLPGAAATDSKPND